MQVKTSLKEDLKKKIYSVSFSLSGKTDNRDALTAELKKYPGWCKVWETQWFICSSDSSAEICKHLRGTLNASDYLFVCNVTADRMGLLPANVINWLQDVSKKQQ